MTDIQKTAATKGYWTAVRQIEELFAGGLITQNEARALKQSIAHRA